MADVKLFLSCVSDEFGAYREVLRHALTRPNVEIKIQEDFKALGGDTLDMLDDYIEHCDAVVHFVGDMAGSAPAPTSVDDFLSGGPNSRRGSRRRAWRARRSATLTYTQWEAWLAIGFNQTAQKHLSSSRRPTAWSAARPSSRPTLRGLAGRASAAACGRSIVYPGTPFTNADNLVAQVLASAVLDALMSRGTPPRQQPRNLPLPRSAACSPAARKRSKTCARRCSARRAARSRCTGLAASARRGSRSNMRWAREADYSALMFVSASDEAALNAGLAALAGAGILDLPEKEARDDATKIAAALRWLEANPTWLMILDNVDDEAGRRRREPTSAAAEGRACHRHGAGVEFPCRYPKLELDALDEDAATQFLLDRTADDRSQAQDDAALARTLARELGGLALGLEQAGAHIATERIGFARYLALWNEVARRRSRWSDPVVTGSEKTLATTWTTSVARLTPESRRLLDRLAFLAPDPIPDSLLDVAVPGEAADATQLRRAPASTPIR